MNTRELISRLYFYTKLGWGNYIAWWLGSIAYLTIIYELLLKNFIPASPFTYLAIFMGMMLLSLFLGYYMKELKVYGIEHRINTETNPYNYKLLKGSMAHQLTTIDKELMYYSALKDIEFSKFLQGKPVDTDIFLKAAEIEKQAMMLRKKFLDEAI
jgi:signal transduction histidine kinase